MSMGGVLLVLAWRHSRLGAVHTPVHQIHYTIDNTMVGEDTRKRYYIARYYPSGH